MIKNILLQFIAAIMLATLVNAGENMQSIYDFEVVNIDGEKISMQEYKGKVLLIVNVASECGFTPQYKGLETLYKEYSSQGFMVLGFPSNQFNNQEPGDNQKIKYFCQERYSVDFDMFSKIDVNGNNAEPLYSYLKEEQNSFLWSNDIKWNFTKFLVDRDGKVVERYAPFTAPKSIEKDIVALLK